MKNFIQRSMNFIQRLLGTRFASNCIDPPSPNEHFGTSSNEHFFHRTWNHEIVQHPTNNPKYTGRWAVPPVSLILTSVLREFSKLFGFSCAWLLNFIVLWKCWAGKFRFYRVSKLSVQSFKILEAAAEARVQKKDFRICWDENGKVVQ